jgi:glycosyltransferase involved in cell wall biosynthesis
MPKVSVVVPNYNHAKFLAQRIETILTQTYQDFELILLDDCSTDGSRGILMQYAGDPRVRIEFNEVNSGSGYRQWNKGVRLAQGKYVWIAESDDYADKHLLEKLVGVLDSDANIGYAYCRSWQVKDGKLNGYICFGEDRLNPRWATNFCVDGREEFANYFAWYNPVRNASAVVFRKDVYERAGGVEESFRLSGDWKLWSLMALEGKVAYVCEPLNYQRFHGANTQMNTDIATTVAEILDIARSLHERVSPPEAVLEKLRLWTVGLWVPAVLSLRTPNRRRWSIIRNVISVYPHPLRGAGKAALNVLRLKIQRHRQELHAGAIE